MIFKFFKKKKKSVSESSLPLNEQFGCFIDNDIKDKDYNLEFITYKCVNPLGRSRVHKSYEHGFNAKDSKKNISAAWVNLLSFGPHHKYELSVNKLHEDSLRSKFYDKRYKNGTSIRAVADVLKKENLIQNYYWANSVEEVWNFIVSTGVVIITSDWYEGMTNLNKYFYADTTGNIIGKNCFLIYGAESNQKSFVCRNFWGKSWGNQGDFYLSFDNLDFLFRKGAQCASASPV